MSRSLQILCLTVLLAPNAFADNQPVSSIQALQDSLSSIDHSFSRHFCLTGTVCSKDGPRLAIPEDRDRRFTFLDWTTNAPSCTIGDLIAASGHYGLKAERRGDEPYAVLKKVEVLQHGAPPVPTDRHLDESKTGPPSKTGTVHLSKTGSKTGTVHLVKARRGQSTS